MSTQIRKLNNNDVPEVERFLARHADTSMFIRSNMRNAGLEYESRDYAGEYWGVYESSKLVGVIAQYWNGNVMMQVPQAQHLIDVTQILMKEHTRPIKGILGDAEQSDIVINLLGLKSSDFAVNETEGLFALDLNDLVFQPREGCSLISPADMDQKLLFDWMKAYDIEALGSQDNEALDKRIAEGIIGKWQIEHRRVLLDNGVPVSLVGCNAQVEYVNQIGPVWTPPEHRNKGYARLALAMFLKDEKAKGIERSILFTKDGSAAERAYLAIGYKRIGAFKLALLK